MDTGLISHTGRIVDVTPSFTSVEIISESACGSCHAKGFCGLGESKIKLLQLPTVPGDWNVGDIVTVNLRKSMGFKAVWIAYVIPLLILVLVLTLGLHCGLSELVSALVSLGALAVYYFAVFLFRDRLKNEYSFYIKK